MIRNERDLCVYLFQERWYGSLQVDHGDVHGIFKKEELQRDHSVDPREVRVTYLPTDQKISRYMNVVDAQLTSMGEYKLFIKDITATILLVKTINRLDSEAEKHRQALIDQLFRSI